MTEQRFLGRQEINSDVRRIQALFGTLYAGRGREAEQRWDSHSDSGDLR